MLTGIWITRLQKDRIANPGLTDTLPQSYSVVQGINKPHSLLLAHPYLVVTGV